MRKPYIIDGKKERERPFRIVWICTDQQTILMAMMR